jgi:hypothetical protein
MMTLKARTLVVMALVAGAFGMAETAEAQTSGVRFGAGVFRPRLILGLEYQTNANRSSGIGPTDPATGAQLAPIPKASDLVLRIQPDFTLAYPSKIVLLLLRGQFNYGYFFGLSNQPEVLNPDGSIKQRAVDTGAFSQPQGTAGIDLTFNPKGQVSFILTDTFRRSNDPANNSLQERVALIYNRAGAILDYKPGGGALSFQLGYSYEFTKFDASTQLDFFNTQAHNVGFQAKWKLLPRTALLFQADVQIPVFNNSATFGGIPVATADQYPFRARVGLASQLTSALQIKAMLGFGATFSKSTLSNSNYTSIIGQVELLYMITRTLALNAGYSRGFAPAALYNYTSRDQFSLGLNAIFARRVKVGVRGSLAWENFGEVPTAIVGQFGFDQKDRQDRVIGVMVPLEVGIIRYLSFEARYGYEDRSSDNLGQSYNNHTIYGGFKAQY